jgi:uncharacterized protein with NRDE domain
MCLIAIAWKAHPDYQLVVAANRDEWRARPTAPADWWEGRPGLLAGRDLEAGGTWMGVTRGGRFCAVTNFRDPSGKRGTARSRGELVADFLSVDESPAAYCARLAARAGDYNGFNLLAGFGDSLVYFGSREGEARGVEPGIHALSNHLLDEPWPKVRRAREAMRESVGNGDEPLFAMLSDATPGHDGELPDTGVGLAWERRLSPALITGEDYGTRASTVLRIAAGGQVRFEERTRDATGTVTDSRAFAFEIAP